MISQPNTISLYSNGLNDTTTKYQTL